METRYVLLVRCSWVLLVMNTPAFIQYGTSKKNNTNLKLEKVTSMAHCDLGCSSAPPRVWKLCVTDLTPETFAPYGQLISPQPDGVQFGCHDAQLELSRGIPRFYLMTLKNRTMQFDTITHHANVTQCLGSIQGNRWYVGVARPTIIGATERLDCELQSQVLHGNGGYSYLPPRPEDVRLFRVDGPRFLKLHVGTWHAGPLFCEPSMDFYNLELSNTNVVDHPNHFFKKSNGIVFEVCD